MTTPSQGELNFLMRMRDQASKVLKQFGVTAKGAADDVDDLGDSNEEASKTFDDIASAVREAAVALTGFATSRKMIGAFNQSWQGYEDGLLGVVKTTNMTAAETAEFRGEFKQLNREMKGISTAELFEISGAAGQLGIRGTENILEFSEVLAKLSKATDIEGGEGTASVARILDLTGEGVENVREFGDVLNYLGNNANAMESQILSMAQSLAQGTAEFGLSSTAVLGIAATAQEAGLQMEVFGSVSGRTMRTLFEQSQSAQAGFQRFLSVAGMTREEFDTLLAQKPEQILIRFAQAYQQVAKVGGGTAFLEGLGLNTDEVKRVFGALGTNLDGVQQRMEALYRGDYAGALDEEVGKFFGAQSSKVENAGRAVQDFGRMLGEGLAPLTNLSLDVFAASLDALVDVFEAMPGPVRTTVAAVLVMIPALVALNSAMAILRTALGGMTILQVVGAALANIGKIAAGVGATVLRFGALFARVFTIIQPLIAGAVGLLAGITAPMWLIIAAVTAVGAAFVWVFKDQIMGALKAAWDTLVSWGENVKGWFAGWLGEDIAIKTELVAPPNAGTVLEQAQKDMEQSKPVVAYLVGNSQQILDEIDKRRELTQQIEQQEQALSDMRRVMDAPLRDETFTYSEKDYKRLQGLVEVNKEALDPVQQRTREIGREIAAAGAVTAAMEARLDIENQIEDTRRQLGYLDEQERQAIQSKLQMLNQVRDAVAAQQNLQGLQDDLASATAITREQQNRLEIEKAIRTLMEERVNLTQEEIDATTRLIAQRQAAEQQNAVREMAEGIKNRLQLAMASTRAEKERLEILQQINAWEQANGKLKEEQYATLLAALELEKQVANFQQLQDTLDPVGAAIRSYADDIDTLNNALASGQIDQQRYNQLISQLRQTTMDARNPVAARVKALREETAVMRLSGREAEIAKTVMSETNALREKGVQVTSEMTAAIREYATAMQDAKAAESGFANWAESVGTLEENLGRLQEDFADGLADAISGALSGDTQSFAKFAQNLGKQMVNMAVRQIMADAFKGFGNPKKDAALDRADAALAKLDALSTAGINAPQAIVNAGAVSLNGADLTGLTDLANMPAQQQLAPALSAVTPQVTNNITSAVEEGVAKMSVPTQPIGSLLNSSTPPLPVTVKANAAQTPIPVQVPAQSLPPLTSMPANDNITAGMNQLSGATTALNQTAASIDGAYKDLNNWLNTSFGAKPAQSTVPQLPNLSQLQVQQAVTQAVAPAFPVMKPANMNQAVTTGLQQAFGEGRYAEVGNFVARGADRVNGDLRKILETAAIEGGFNVEAYSGIRPGSSGFHGKGLAADVKLLDQQGKIIGGSQHGGHYQTSAGFAEYERYAQEVRRVQQRDFPQLDEELRWGGYFGGKWGKNPATGKDWKYGAGDGMHFDLGGNQVGMAGGSWEGGLSQAQRNLLASQGYNPVSIGMAQGGQPNMPHLQQTPQVDTSAVTNSINQMNTSLQTMNTTMQPMPAQIQTASTALQGQGMQTQTLGMNSQMTSMNMQVMNPAMQQVGTGAQQAGQAAQTAGPAFQQAGQQVQQAAQQARMASSGVGQFGSGVQGLQGPLSQATSASGSFGSSIMSLVQQLMSGMGGGGGMGGMMGLFGGLFADGGLISGPGTGRSDSILAGVSNGEFIVNAKATKEHLPLLKAINDNKQLKVPAFADGGLVKLNRGEQGMRARAPANDTSGMVKELIEAVGNTKASKQERGSRTQNNSVNMTVYAQDAASFRRSEGQLLADSSAKMARMGGRNN